MTQPSANDTTPDEPWLIEFWWQGKRLDRIVHTYPREWAIRDVYLKWRALDKEWGAVTVRFKGNGEDLDHEQFMAAVPPDLIAWGERTPRSELPDEFVQQVKAIHDLPPFIVLRPAPGLGPGILDDAMNGQWYDREDIQVLGPDQTIARLAGDVVFVAVATDRIETDPERPPGRQTAQVWEVRP